MADRVYPSTKPAAAANPLAAATAAAPILNPPPAKAHQYNPPRHPYRPTPITNLRPKYDGRRHSRRRRCCLACFWSILVLIAILLLGAIAGAAFYVLYHPHRPLFSVASLKIAALNLTTTPADESTRLSTRINITLSAKNPNNKITYLYDPISIAVKCNSIGLSSGSFGGFVSSPENITIIHTTLAMNSKVLAPEEVKYLKSDLKRRRGLPMEIVMDTKVGVKVESAKPKKVRIRIRCGGIHWAMMRKGKNVTSANLTRARCEVDLRIKIYKWTF